MGLLSILGPQPLGRQAGVQPLDGAAGGAMHSSVHRPGLRVQRLQPADDQADRHHEIRARRLEAHRSRLDLLDRHLLPRRLGGGVRPLGRGRRPAPGDVRRGALLRRRVPGQRVRRVGPPALDRLSRLRRARRLRPRTRLHLAGVDADQMVSRPARHGDRHGDHGLRRRGHDRLAAFGVADERFLDPDACRGRRDLCRPGTRLRLLHAGRRGDRARAARRAGSQRATFRRLSPRSSSPPRTSTSIRR